MELHTQQKYAEAYDLLTAEGDQFSDDAPEILYLRSCMAARTGRSELAISLIEETLDRGGWYGERILRESPSWAALQGNPDFERLAQLFLARQTATQGKPVSLVLEPEGGCAPDGEDRCPLFLTLHGNWADPRKALEGWKPVVEMGWMLASLQSTQALSSANFVWDDQEIAVQEATEQYARLKGQYAVDTGRVIISGFSMGGETALRLALTGAIPARGFILLGPGGPLTIEEPQGWQPLIETARDRGLRGYVLLGEQEDAALLDGARKTVEMLNAGGIPCELEILPNIGHRYPRPEDFAPAIRRALAFVDAR
jgi:predicted esterase